MEQVYDLTSSVEVYGVYFSSEPYEVGSLVRMECRYSADNLYSLTWYKDGQTIFRATRMQYGFREETFDFPGLPIKVRQIS